MNQTELAEAFGVNRTAINQWVAEGMPVLRPGRRGIAAEYDLNACRDWARRNGRGLGFRVDRPSGVARVHGAPAFLDNIEEDLGGLCKRAQEDMLDCVLDNFPVATAALIKFEGIEPSEAVRFARIAVFQLVAVVRRVNGLSPLESCGDRVLTLFNDIDRAKERATILARDLWEENP